jgi:hypothetical protein
VASRQIGVLVGKRLVQRIAAAPGHARHEVRATAAGQCLYADLFPQLAAINRRLMAALDTDEALVLERLLDKLWDRARAIREQDAGTEPDQPRADRRHGGSRRRWETAAGNDGPD